MNNNNLSVMLEKNKQVNIAVMQYFAFPEQLKKDWVGWAKIEWAKFRKSHGFVCSAPKLLTHPANQSKLGKSDIYTVGLTLQHANVSGWETCAWRTPSCTATCVLDNGNGRYDMVQKARTVKTLFLAEKPTAFMLLLCHELRVLSMKYDNLLVRLNVNSDLRWYKIAPSLFTSLPTVAFYDYTKNPAVLRTTGMVADNYRLCYSISESDTTKRMGNVDMFVRSGGTAAVVTIRNKKDAPPSVWRGNPVVDGDVTDDRFNERGVFVDLTAKGKARKISVNPFGFVRDIAK
jgi:hypothetical protein